MISAQEAGGALGPMLQAFLRESTGTYAPALLTISALMVAATIVSVGFRPVHADQAPGCG